MKIRWNPENNPEKFLEAIRFLLEMDTDRWNDVPEELEGILTALNDAAAQADPGASFAYAPLMIEEEKYYPCVIKQDPDHAGRWIATRSDDGWTSEYELKEALWGGLARMYELGVDAIPDGIEDIRSKIINPPDRVFAVRVLRGQREEWKYVGIVKA